MILLSPVCMIPENVTEKLYDNYYRNANYISKLLISLFTFVIIMIIYSPIRFWCFQRSKRSRTGKGPMRQTEKNGIWEFWGDAVPGVVFFIMYITFFRLLESRSYSREEMWLIHAPLDDFIPFSEIFIIPYLLWFVFVFLTFAWRYLYDSEGYQNACLFMFTGMSVFLIVSALIPNGLNLRPAVMPRDNVFTHLTAMLYRGDTSTNVFPSIHVYNSMACAFAAVNTRTLNNHRIWRFFWIVMATLVILSTTFLKQHSVMDVSAALLMSMLVYIYVYRKNEVAAPVPAGHLGRVDFS